MFKWLTRNDGARAARAKRRIASSRASVFMEFAMIMPVVAMVCSALIEVAGLWDAQVMANHAAWTVGRIAMVRGSDGLVFSESLDKKSKTGIKGSKMPAAIKEALKDVDAIQRNANKFNNRANIATLFLMSTCGIGYYGYSPGKALSTLFDTLCKSGVKAVTDGVKGWIGGMSSSIEVPSLLNGGGDGIERLVNNLVAGIVNKIVDAVISPIVNALAQLLQDAFAEIMKRIDLDGLFAGGSEAARRARQIYGAGVRIVRAHDTIGKDAVTVEDMDDLNDYYMFAEESSKPGFKHLAYPQVVDAGAKSDGYFVKDYHGWPPNAQGHAMIHVEINWPYESGWLFPVVSGRDDLATDDVPAATGHSMVFPQPDIQNEHLYSEGATAFAPGTYTNNTTASYQDIVDDMRNYMRYVLFSMQYRISEESLSLGDEAWYVHSWKRCNELKKLFGLGNGKKGGDYGSCWSVLTDNKAQDALLKDLEPYFKEWSYHSRDYFYWNGRHYKYRIGYVGLGDWYNWYPASTFANDKANKYFLDNDDPYRKDDFDRLYDRYKMSLDPLITPEMMHGTEKRSLQDIFRLGGHSKRPITRSRWLRSKIAKFADRNKVNVANVVKWRTDLDFDAWTEADRTLKGKANAADTWYSTLCGFVEREIREVNDIVNGGGEYKGDPDDPVITPDDEEAMKDPDKAAAQTRAKWEELKAKLTNKLAELDSAAVDARNACWAYSSAARSFENDREACTAAYFVEACFKLAIAKEDATIFDAGRDKEFALTESEMSYNIHQKTLEMLAKIEEYRVKIDAAYKKEIEYGAMMGLQAAGRAKREGKSIDQVVGSAGDGGASDKPGTLTPGSDKATIINDDQQEFSGGKWIWKK